MGIFETFKHSYLIRDLMLFLIVQLFVQLEIWSIVSLFNYFCSIVVCSIVELFYWLLWSKFFVQLTFVESVFCSIVLFNWSCSIWSRSTDMEGFFPSKVAPDTPFLSCRWTDLATILVDFWSRVRSNVYQISAKSVDRRPRWHNFWRKKTQT